jgi:hypothetical protein
MQGLLLGLHDATFHPVADYSEPAIALRDVHAKVIAGFWHIRREAQLNAIELGLHLAVRTCLLALSESDFHKSMDAEEPKWAGCRQDVYRPELQATRLYVKLQLWPIEKGFIYVVSFKERDI